MRISRHQLLVLWLCLLAAGIQVSNSQALAQPKPPATKKVLFEHDFTGYGKTETLAKADALEQAGRWLAEEAQFDWSPTPDYLHQKNMVQFGESRKQKFEVAEGLAKEGEMILVSMHLEVTADQARDIHKQAQHQRMAQRQKPLLYGLVGVAALLGVVVGYLRLEEATKGYFTRRLRIMAVGILLAIIAAGLCVIG